MKILIFDTECNGLDLNGGYVMEIAWASFHAESKRCLEAVSYLVKWEKPYDVEEGAFEVTGLSRDFCETHGREAQFVFGDFEIALRQHDAVCGHNIIDFDIPMAQLNFKRALLSESDTLREKFQIDTMYDCPYPKSQKMLSLKYLSLDHGYVLAGAHEALMDVFACAHILFSYPLAEVLARASTPLMTIHGFTAYSDEHGREAFFRQKFRWNREHRRWEKRQRAFNVPGTQLSLGNYDLFHENNIIKINADELKEDLPF